MGHQMPPRLIVAALLIALAALPAAAQPAPDPIGDTLATPPHVAPPPTEAAPSTPAPQSAPSGRPPAPASAPAPPAHPAGQVDQTGVSGGPPMSPSDISYEERIRASVAAAQSYQGPMDGRWTLYDPAGKPLYIFMFVDPAGGRGVLEAAWRDPRRAHGADDLGVVDSLQKTDTGLTLNFVPHSGGPAVQIQLQGDPAGALGGQMTENGAATPVTLRRP